MEHKYNKTTVYRQLSNLVESKFLNVFEIGGIQMWGKSQLEKHAHLECQECSKIICLDINSRRGQVTGSGQRGKATVVSAEVPLENLFGYISDLRGSTKGLGTASMEFSRYAEVPRNIQEKIVSERGMKYTVED